MNMSSTLSSNHPETGSALGTKFASHKFIMTVDVDGWPSLLSFYGVAHDYSKAEPLENVEEGLQRLLDLFEKHQIFATFFTTGDMARMHPEMVRKIFKKGHEIACHGLLHLKDEYIVGRLEQEKRLKEATDIIEKVIGKRPIGFRAPCLRANEDTFELLSENGYLYDSSMIPTLIPGYYGYLSKDSKPHWLLNTSNHIVSEKRILEIPVSVNPILRVPLSAAWLRNLGASWVKLGVLLNLSFDNPVTLYVHPRDVLSLPVIKGVPWHLYRNVGLSTLRMLDEVLSYARNHGAAFVRASDLAKVYHNSF
jgi:peptidoglycan/xylan/chitin deacetylase (PgdA/CDA1 family)